MPSSFDEVGQVLRALQVDASALLSTLQTSLPEETDALDTPKAPSLLTLKNAALLSYLQHLVLLTSGRLRGQSLSEGNGKGSGHGPQLVRNLIELRLILEKIRPLESKTRTLIERLLRAADDEDKRIREGRGEDDDSGNRDASADAGSVDPLSFRPNLAALSATANTSKSGQLADAGDDQHEASNTSRDRGDGIYRPPRLAPVAYNADAGTLRGKDKSKVAPRNAALLADLSASMSANPYETSSGGVGVNGGSGAHASARAKALRRMDQYEEENFTRLGMSKRDAKRRRRDEADVALGGAGLSSKRGRVGAGLEEEFGDLLRNSGKDDLRSIKRKGALERSREASSGSIDNVLESSGARGDGKFRRQMSRSRAKGKKKH